jgi:hypothetical protein
MTQFQNKRLRNRHLLSWNSVYRAQRGHQTADLEARAAFIFNCTLPARDAPNSPNVIKRTPQLVLFALLIALGSAAAYAASPGTVSGVVRDSAGVPQIGAQVELLRPDLSILASVFTDTGGHFVIGSVLPGHYAVKAMGSSFLPSVRPDVRVRSSAVVDLTLNTLYEVMQWLPSMPRSGNAEPDDWKWTLRSAANRPLLRWLEDGPLVVVSDGSGKPRKLKARLVATGQQGTFGESGERVSAAVEETPSSGHELLAEVDFDPASNAAIESTLGFRQDLGIAGSVESVGSLSIHPEVEGAGGEALNEFAIRSFETINMGDMIDAEVGSTQVMARFGENSPNTILAALPFATVAWHSGDSTLHYRMSTSVPRFGDMGDADAQASMPALSLNNGRLTMEHGLHQEIGWQRQTANSSAAVLIYADSIHNPMLEAAGKVNSAGLLYDPESGIVRAAGPSYSSYGVVASAQHRLPRGGQVRASYATGNALVLASVEQPSSVSRLLASARPRQAQTCSISLSGTLDGSGTRWRATYRWQPEATVNAVAPFSEGAEDPYLNVRLTQPIHLSHDGSGGFEAMVDLRNLLAQGYRPYVLSDGSVLVFAEDQRGVAGGLAFTF